MFKKIPLIVKIVLCIVFPPFFFIWLIFGGIGPAISFAAKENTAFSNLVNYPSKETAQEYIQLMRNRPVFIFTDRNHPDVWAVLREKWQIINHSDNIPTNLKKEVLDILIDKGLYVRSSKIIDNYKNSNEQ